jgi:hypothetical protein
LVCLLISTQAKVSSHVPNSFQKLLPQNLPSLVNTFSNPDYVTLPLGGSCLSPYLEILMYIKAFYISYFVTKISKYKNVGGGCLAF